MWILIGIATVLLVVCSISDIQKREISVPIVLAFLIISVIYKGYYGLWWSGCAELLFRLLPGMIMLAISHLMKKDLGYGDAILTLVCGYILGSEYILYLLMAGSLFSGIYGLLLMKIKKCDKKTTIPFVPFLLTGCIVMGGYLWAKGLM